MARHRIVRTLDYNDEYDGFDDVYGHSMEEDSPLSPTDSAQWMYDPAKNRRAMSQFLGNNDDIEEEEETEGDVVTPRPGLDRRESLDIRTLKITDEDEVKLMSCLDELRNVLGDNTPDNTLVNIVLKNKFDFNASLDEILNSNKKTEESKPLAKDLPKAKLSVDPSYLQAQSKSSETPIVISSVNEPNTQSVIKGFKINESKDLLSPTAIGSPRCQSPASGRGTPKPDTEEKTPYRTKESKTDPSIQYSNERGSEKDHLYIVVIGHVDAGKSTLMGRLLCDLGKVSQKTLHKYEQESKKIGKQSFMYAWVLDETGEERVRGITMDVGKAQFQTESKHVTILDAPGHADFIPNMISGAGQADVALLVIDATRGEFESGFDLGGQTREHALLVRSLGVNQLAVAINKLDTTNWSQERFIEISNKLKLFLKQAGFKDSDVTFVPCSGLTGENLIKNATEPKLLSWYSGPCLLEVIDKFKVPERPVSKPFRMSINDIFKGTGSGSCVAGKVETGVLNKGDKVLVCPTKEPAEVKTLFVNELPANVAFAGDQVSVTLSGVDVQNISIGFILSDPVKCVPVTTRFEARIVVFNVKVPITKGFPVLIHHQSLIESANIVKLKALLNKSTGEVLKKKPRCLGNNSVALVDLEVSKPICIELYKDVKELGRVMLRVGGVTIAAGLITNIFY